ncbi:MAG: FRG domain-containing protein [Candidatus Lokiarchaeota archaeon]|nr:FRG domain-containing protein [Candidatus Lokiarchaeota archaeon]
MNEIRIDSWNQLNDELFKGWWTPKIRRFRAPLAYRGVSNSTYCLETSLMRLGGKYAKIEPHLLRNFKKYAGKEIARYSRQDVSKFNSIWHWLIVGQHHGLPTRLLDWTYSPLVALYFATSNLEKTNKDGAIWVVNFIECSKYLPEKVMKPLFNSDSRVHSIELLEETFSGTLKALKNLETASDEEYAIFLEPPSIDDRVVNQFAMFSFMSNPKTCMDDWLQKYPEERLWRKIIVPSELKVEIRDKLSQSNINERTMFPGLDGICRWLCHYYAPGK